MNKNLTQKLKPERFEDLNYRDIWKKSTPGKGKRNTNALKWDPVCYIPRGRSLQLEGVRKGKSNMRWGQESDWRSDCVRACCHHKEIIVRNHEEFQALLTISSSSYLTFNQLLNSIDLLQKYPSNSFAFFTFHGHCPRSALTVCIMIITATKLKILIFSILHIATREVFLNSSENANIII